MSKVHRPGSLRVHTVRNCRSSSYVRDRGLLGSADSPGMRKRAYDNFGPLTSTLCECPAHRSCPTIKGNCIDTVQSRFTRSPIDCEIVSGHRAVAVASCTPKKLSSILWNKQTATMTRIIVLNWRNRFKIACSPIYHALRKVPSKHVYRKRVRTYIHTYIWLSQKLKRFI